MKTHRSLIALAALLALSACSDLLSPDNSYDASKKKSGSTFSPAPLPNDPPPAPPLPVSGNPITGSAFWVDPNSSARQTADAWRLARPDDAAQLDKIANNSQAQWFVGSSPDIKASVNATVTTVSATGAVPVLVAYNIPQRDCGGLSAGGTTVDGYRSWILGFAAGIGARKAVVILEPDALTQMDCLSTADQTTRIYLIKYAVSALKAQGNQIAVYLDAGHAAWKSPADEASRLNRANVDAADGFALNVSNFQYTSSSISYGKAISALIGGKHFVIDTSRNGLGPTSDNQWCNPEGRALGAAPTTVTADVLVDAYLWVKAPGESDGACNGAPAAGVWWADYALGLAQRSTL